MRIISFSIRTSSMALRTKWWISDFCLMLKSVKRIWPASWASSAQSKWERSPLTIGSQMTRPLVDAS